MPLLPGLLDAIAMRLARLVVRGMVLQETTINYREFGVFGVIAGLSAPPKQPMIGRPSAGKRRHPGAMRPARPPLTWPFCRAARPATTQQ